jgi:phospholipase C
MQRKWPTRIAPSVLAALLQSSVLLGAWGQDRARAGDPSSPDEVSPIVTLQPSGPDEQIPYAVEPRTEPTLSNQRITALLRQRIKYVFVIFNENHSFDNEFGTFPGVDGLYADWRGSRAASATPGFYQSYQSITGENITVTPFLIDPAGNSNVVDSVDHSHTGLATKLHVDPKTGQAQMDQFAAEEYHRFASPGGSANQAMGTQYARLVMSHVDCDTLPFLWSWASHFTIFDGIFATEDTPSTPNAIAMIAGQSGATQWVKHPSANPAQPLATGFTGPLFGTINGVNYAGQTGTTQGPPIVNDPQPFYGSEFDRTVSSGRVEREPSSPSESYGPKNIASNLTFASVPLTLLGRNVTEITRQNLNPGFDLPDIQQDIPYIQELKNKPVPWRWYQEGYDHESSDPSPSATHASYVSHHEGPQYFGYLANTPPLRANLRGMSDFFNDMTNHALPEGGVFYIRGGYHNQMHLVPVVEPGTPAAKAKAIVAAKSGDDDHPAYSDRQISEAMAARVINAIASNPRIWAQSAIIITYDESDGFFDHVPPRILSYGPDGLPLSRGLRVPLILISPYARSHAVSHVEGDHNAVIETINAIFGLPALASLPDEAQALKDGNSEYFNHFAPAGFKQEHLGPDDIESPISESLLSGFSPSRLLGRLAPLPAALATIPPEVVSSLPHYAGMGCRAIGITPTRPANQPFDYPPPPGFNNLPSTYPAAN